MTLLYYRADLRAVPNGEKKNYTQPRMVTVKQIKNGFKLIHTFCENCHVLTVSTNMETSLTQESLTNNL